MPRTKLASEAVVFAPEPEPEKKTTRERVLERARALRARHPGVEKFAKLAIPTLLAGVVGYAAIYWLTHNMDPVEDAQELFKFLVGGYPIPGEVDTSEVATASMTGEAGPGAETEKPVPPQSSEVNEPKTGAESTKEGSSTTNANTSSPQATTEKPASVTRPSADAYKTATLNIEQIAEPSNNGVIGLTPERVQGFQSFMAERGISLSEAEARTILERGGYSADGHYYEVWAHPDRTSPVEGRAAFFTIETPEAREYPDVEGATLPDHEPKPVPVEVPDAQKDEVLVASAKIGNETVLLTFAQANPHAPGTAEAAAWETVHSMLKTMPDDWKTSTMTLGEFLHKAGFVK